MLAAAVNCYFRAIYSDLDAARRAMWAQQKADKEAQKALTQWYCEIGKRIDLPIKIMEKKRIETDSLWGNVMLIKTVMLEASELVWFTGSGAYSF